MTYEALIQNIRELPIDQRKRIVLDILDSLTEGEPIKQRNILEFEGVGAHLRDDTLDAQEYIKRLRSEWDHRA